MPTEIKTPPSAEEGKRLRNVSLYLIPVVIGNIIPFFTLPLFTRALSAADYGLLALAQAFATSVAGFANFGLNTVYDRSFHQYREPSKAAALLYSCVGFVALLLLLCTAVTAVFHRPISMLVFGSTAYGGLALWGLASLGVLKLETFFYARLRNSEHASEFAFFTILESCLDALFGITLVVILRKGPAGLLIGPLMSGIIVTIVMSARTLRRLPFALDRSVFLHTLALSAPLVPLMFAGILSSQLDKYLVGRMNSLEGAGLYGIGQRIAMVGFSYMTALSNVFFPRIYRMMFDKDLEAADDIGRYLTPFFVFSLAAPLCIALFSEELLKILTPPSYHPAAELVSILCLYYGLQFFGKTPQIMYRGKGGLLSVLGFLNLPLNLLFGLPLVLLWGARGAALALLAAGAIQMTIFFILSQRSYPIGWEYRKIGPLLAYFFAAVAITFPLHTLLTTAPYFLCKLALAGGFFALAHVQDALPPTPLREMLSRLPKLWGNPSK
ncbi:MAG: oligosaccharide flippase family protein [Elusimicrobiota bacterium]|jgi:O-antigen/teichoic acid export membrane protein